MAAIIKIPKINVVPATKRHTATLFFFHGSGGSGEDLKQYVDELNRGELRFPHIKIVYPSAPLQHYAFSNTMENVWFNRKDIRINGNEQTESINLMCNAVTDLIDEESVNGIECNRIALSGFSMGGALAMHLLYRYKPSLAGCAVMSSFLNKNSTIYEHLKNQSTVTKSPLLQFHGEQDTLVPHKWGEEVHNRLKTFGVDAKFISLPNTDHMLTEYEIKYLKEWLVTILPE
ncbi:hypothetical protein KM043_001905 [Ampulex compressa]|nr:hypothetical protein KM043_001905 [Ampulex compressa]